MPRNVQRYLVPYTDRVFTVSTGSTDSSNARNDLITWTSRQDSNSTIPNKSGAYYKPTSYYGRFYLHSSTAFLYNWTFAGTRKGWEGPMSPVSLACPGLDTYGVTALGFPPDPSPVQSRAASQMQRRVRDQAWDLGQDLAEMPQTIGFILGLLATLRKLISGLNGNPYNLYNLARTAITANRGAKTKNLLRYLKRNKYSLINKSTKSASSAWLAYKFAWLPLMNSISSAVQVAKDGLNSGRPAATCYSHAKEALPGPSLGNGVIRISHLFVGHTEATQSINIGFNSTFLNGLEKLGLTNPLSVAWELLPLSFVLDWFLPIGNFLKAMVKPMGVFFSSGYQTLCVKWRFGLTWRINNNAAGVRYSGNWPSNQARTFSFVRSILLSFPLPVPYLRGIGDSLSVDKAVSMMALAVQRVS